MKNVLKLLLILILVCNLHGEGTIKTDEQSVLRLGITSAFETKNVRENLSINSKWYNSFVINVKSNIDKHLASHKGFQYSKFKHLTLLEVDNLQNKGFYFQVEMDIYGDMGAGSDIVFSLKVYTDIYGNNIDLLVKKRDVQVIKRNK